MPKVEVHTESVIQFGNVVFARIIPIFPTRYFFL